jgi:hypothetical protein
MAPRAGLLRFAAGKSACWLLVVIVVEPRNAVLTNE